jgi:hypothetical protein
MSHKHTEDQAETMADFSSLNRLFNTDSQPLVKSEEHQLAEIQRMKCEIAELKRTQSPDGILYENINRANRILDAAEKELVEDNHINNRLIEVVGGLMSVINAAATSLTDIGFNQTVLAQKEKVLQLRERELEMKLAIKAARNNGEQIPGKVTNNLIVSSREDILKLLRGEQEDCLLEDNSEDDDTEV